MSWHSWFTSPIKKAVGWVGKQINGGGKWLDKKVFQPIKKFTYNPKRYSKTYSHTYNRNYKVGNLIYKNSFTFTVKMHYGANFDLIGKKTEKRRIKEQMSAYFAFEFAHIEKIDTKYKLGLSWYELNSIAQAYIKALDDDNIKNSGFSFYMFLAFIPGVNFITGGLGILGGFLNEMEQNKQNYKQSEIAEKNYALSSSLFSLRLKREEQNRSKNKDNLTNLIIKNKYDIYANGALFKKGAAGSQTFSPSVAYDPLKGLNGANLPDTSIDDMIMSRVGANKAGGVQFINNLCDINFATFNLSKSLIKTALKSKYLQYVKRINKGFELIDTFYINGDKHSAYFNADGNASKTYNRVIKTQTHHIKKAIISDDFFDKLTNYNQNLRADFDFIHLKDFDKKSNKKAKTEKIPSYDERWKEYMDDEKISKDDRAVRYLFEILNKMLRFRAMCYKRHILVNIDKSGKISAILDKKGDLIILNDLTMILDGLFLSGKDEIKAGEIFDIFDNKFVPNFKQVDVYKGDKIIANYAFVPPFQYGKEFINLLALKAEFDQAKASLGLEFGAILAKKIKKDDKFKELLNTNAKKFFKEILRLQNENLPQNVFFKYERSCVFADIDTFKILTKKPYLPKSMQDYDFVNLILKTENGAQTRSWAMFKRSTAPFWE